MTGLAVLDADAVSQPSGSNEGSSHRGPARSVSLGGPKVAQLIAADIRVKIVRRELKVGDNLPPEAKLASAYDVSRPTIRAALRLLETEGLLSVRRGGRFGPEIVAPNIDFNAHSIATLLQYQGTKVADVWSACTSIECAAIVELISQRGNTDLSSLKEMIGRVREVIDQPHPFTDIGLEFNEELVRLAGNETMLVLFRLLQNIIIAEINAVRRYVDSSGLQSMRDGAPDFMTKVVEMIEFGDFDAVTLWKQRLDAVAAFQLEIIGPATVVDILSFQA